MAPGTEPLQIVVGNKDVTALVPKSSLSMALELANRVSTCRFIVEKATNLNIAVNQTVLITGPVDYAPVYFIGYVTARRFVKRGAELAAELDCSSIAVRLQKSVVDGAYTGTNADILADLLAGTVPDLSNMFDFAPFLDSQIDEFGLDEYTFDVNNESLLDALGEFASLTGADWNIENGSDLAINYFPNPNIYSSMKYLLGAQTYDGYTSASWNSANVVWDSAAGESGGGLQITSQLIGADYVTSFTIGIDASGNLGPVFQKSPNADDMYLYCSFRAKISSDTDTFNYWSTILDDAGNTHPTLSGGGIGASDGGDVTTSWKTFGHGYKLSTTGYDPTTLIPLFSFSTTRVAGEGGALTLYVDKIMMEVFEDSGGFPTAPKNSYYDGDSNSVEWMGTPRDSASLLYTNANTLNWREDADAASFDIDIANMTEIIEDFEFDSTGFDYVNSLIVIGGVSYEDVLWEYPGDAQLTHFDLEVEMFPRTGALIVIDKNTGTDGTPVWAGQTVLQRSGDAVLGGGVDVLWATDTHWLEFNTAPALLKRAFRVTAKIAYQIRATVTDQDEVDSSGMTLTSVYVNDAITSEADAHAIGQQELQRRARPSCKFVTYEPGLLPNRVMNIVDSLSGVSTDLVIERVRKTYLGGGYIRSEVEAGEPPKDIVDVVAGIADDAQARPPVTVSEAAVQLRTLTFGGVPLTRYGAKLYKRVTA